MSECQGQNHVSGGPGALGEGAGPAGLGKGVPSRGGLSRARVPSEPPPSAQTSIRDLLFSSRARRTPAAVESIRARLLTRPELRDLVEERLESASREFSQRAAELSALATKVAEDHAKELQEAARLVRREQALFERTRARLVVCGRAAASLETRLADQVGRVDALFRGLRGIEQRVARFAGSVRALHALPQMERDFSALRASQEELAGTLGSQLQELRRDLQAGLQEAAGRLDALGAPAAPGASREGQGPASTEVPGQKS